MKIDLHSVLELLHYPVNSPWKKYLDGCWSVPGPLGLNGCFWYVTLSGYKYMRVNLDGY